MRAYLVIAVGGLLVGIVVGLGGRAVGLATARHELRSRGYDVAQIERRTLPCPRKAQGYVFTAVRDHRLLAGGICPGGLRHDPLIVTLPPLR